MVGIWAGGHAVQAFGKNDPAQVVVDEVAGSWIALAGATLLNGYALVGAFLLFRLFDIWKPFPIRRLELLPGGMGIMADDLMAGLYAALVLFLAGCLNLY
jgi:phosphatidylglycerophosphatase A